MTDKTHPSEETGPGPIDAKEVGSFTCAKTTLLDERFTMAYAAGINDDNEAYFDDLRSDGLNVHPCIAFSLQWNARHRPDKPVNHRAAPYGVHAESDLRIYHPFKPGEAVTTQGRLIKRQQIRPGVFSVERYQMTNGAGQLLAELDYNSITRGASLTGEDVEIAEIPSRPVLSATPPLWSQDISIGRHAGQQYTECANIYNPIHTQPSVAIKAGLPNIILHGSANKAIALSEIVNRLLGGDSRRVKRLYGQLRAVILMPSTITLECLSDETIGSERHIGFQLKNEQGQLAVSNGLVVATV